MWALMRLPKLILSSIGAQGGRKAEDPAPAGGADALVNGAAVESLGRMLESIPAPPPSLEWASIRGRA